MIVNNSNEILKSSIIDTLPVLVDMSLLSPSECDRITGLGDFSSCVAAKQMIIRLPEKEKGPKWLEKLSADLNFELRKVEMRAALDQSRGIPKPRVTWERQERETGWLKDTLIELRQC